MCGTIRYCVSIANVIYIYCRRSRSYLLVRIFSFYHFIVVLIHAVCECVRQRGYCCMGVFYAYALSFRVCNGEQNKSSQHPERVLFQHNFPTFFRNSCQTYYTQTHTFYANFFVLTCESILEHSIYTYTHTNALHMSQVYEELKGSIANAFTAIFKV